MAAIVVAGLCLASGLGLSIGCSRQRAPEATREARADVSPPAVTRPAPPVDEAAVPPPPLPPTPNVPSPTPPDRSPPPEPEPAIEARAPDAGLRDLLMPVDGVGLDRLHDDFNDARGGSRHHQAIDILAPRNTPVRAVADGTIAKLFESIPGGHTIYQFDPSERYCYYYAHLERYARELHQGDRVRRGQIVGYVGTSGNAPPNTPHLHFAIYRLGPDRRWWEGEPLNPYPVLRGGQ